MSSFLLSVHRASLTKQNTKKNKTKQNKQSFQVLSLPSDFRGEEEERELSLIVEHASFAMDQRLHHRGDLFFNQKQYYPQSSITHRPILWKIRQAPKHEWVAHVSLSLFLCQFMIARFIWKQTELLPAWSCRQCKRQSWKLPFYAEAKTSPLGY